MKNDQKRQHSSQNHMAAEVRKTANSKPSSVAQGNKHVPANLQARSIFNTRPQPVIREQQPVALTGSPRP